MHPRTISKVPKLLICYTVRVLCENIYPFVLYFPLAR